MQKTLTIPQKNIWNLQKYYSDTAIGNQCGTIFYNENRDFQLLKEAIRKVIWSQTGYRLRFTEESEVRQYVSWDADIQIPELTFESEEMFDNYAKQFASEPIGLIDRPMYRFVVFAVNEKSGVLVTLSHLISDAWTFSLLAKEVDKPFRGREVFQRNFILYRTAVGQRVHSQ